MYLLSKKKVIFQLAMLFYWRARHPIIFTTSISWDVCIQSFPWFTSKVAPLCFGATKTSTSMWKKDIPTALSWGHLVSFWHVFFLYYNEQESGSTRITRYNHLIQKKPLKAGFRECFRSSERISKRCCRWSQTRRIDYKNRIYALRSLSLLHVFVVCFSLALAGGRLPGNLYINWTSLWS